MPDYPSALAPKSQDSVLDFARNCTNMLGEHWDVRPKLENIDIAYQREGNYGYDDGASRAANRVGDKSKIQDVVVPIVYTQTETALAYLASVFLTGNPIFGIVAKPSVPDEAAVMAETILMENSIRQGWIRHLLLWFRDGLKYNINAIECDWAEETIYQPITDLTFNSKVGRPKDLLWQGNKLKRMDMYNTLWDTRVAPAEVHTKGEFAGYVELVSRIELKQYLENLPDGIASNKVKAFEAPYGLYENYYIPSVNPDPLLQHNPRASTNWMAWATAGQQKSGIQYNNMYERLTLYARIIPSDFGMNVPARNLPQIWKFVIINNSVVVYAERKTNAHNLLPIIFSQPLEDGLGLGYQTKSFAQNVVNSQDVASALWNSRIASARRRLTDRVLYDPTRIREADINSPSVTAKIPVRPGLYGKSVNDAVYQFPFDDRNAQFFTQESQSVWEMAGYINGINKVQEGQFQRGNKTLREFQTVMSNSNSRLQMMALFIQAQALTPLKEIIKLNILQYQQAASYYNLNNKERVEINPETLRDQSFQYTITDGLLPADKVLNSDFMQVFMQTAVAIPEMAMEYDLMGMFAYFYREQGMRITLSDFKRSPEEKAQMMQQLAARTQAETPPDQQAAAAAGQAAPA